ncbi:MAG TPA: NapC/NirT family cytochrome c [Candidatus Sumerlaeota bacterium]|nr:NapC/NirT family cytochrome c [Candidatus Sumerlaeota bacterium]
MPNDLPPDPDPTAPPPPLSRNPVSYLGWIVVAITGAALVVLILMDILQHQENPYNSLVTYLVLPGVLGAGIALILGGIALEWRRRHRKAPSTYPRLPLIDLNLPWQRRRILAGVGIASLLFTVSSVGTYQAYHFTESPVFCGQICHHVMEPEYTAYQHSPHARVACTQCHIGPGADWYVRSKMSGLRQVFAVLTKSYELPIETPVHNLRPARHTCEQCHWPAQFSDSVEKIIWHFSPDRANTPARYNLLLKIGGGMPDAGLGRGIHWHINPSIEVRYWARDRQRLDIPYVEVRREDGSTESFRSPDCPDPLPPDAELRLMDCIDCHNRPSHIYRSPKQLIDFYMATGVLDDSLPYLKRYATEIFEQPWPDTPSALAAIDGLRQRYADRVQGPEAARVLETNIDWLARLYQRNFFPEQGVDWRAYPNHLGHFEFSGCYRCHDDRHVSDRAPAAVREAVARAAQGTGREAEPNGTARAAAGEAAPATRAGHVISNDCRLCHEILDQAEGAAAFAPADYTGGGEFNHPRGLGDIWLGNNCTDCHGLTGQPQPPRQLTQATPR